MLFEEVMRRDGREMTVIRVDLGVLERVIFCVGSGGMVVVEVHIDGHHVDGLCELDLEVLTDELIPIEVAGLVHVQPDPREGDFLIETV